MFNLNAARLGKLSTLAILPLVALAFLVANAARDSSSASPPFVPEGNLVVANLAGDSLTVVPLASGGAPRSLALPGPPHEMLRLNGRLYVTLGRANLLVEVDPGVPAILRTVVLDGHPHGIAADSRGIHVTLDDANQVLTLDPETLAITARVPTGETPHAIVSDGDRLFVTASRDNALQVLDASGSVHAVPTGALPESVAVTRGLAVTAESHALGVFDATTFEHRSTITLPGRPVRVVVSDHHLYAASSFPGAVSVFDLPSLTPVATLETGPLPDGICVSPSGNYVATVTNSSGRAVITDTDTWRDVTTLTVGAGPGSCVWF